MVGAGATLSRLLAGQHSTIAPPAGAPFFVRGFLLFCSVAGPSRRDPPETRFPAVGVGRRWALPVTHRVGVKTAPAFGSLQPNRPCLVPRLSSLRWRALAAPAHDHGCD